MKELYLIMRELLEVEYNQKSLLYIMEMLETAYNEGERECSGLTVNGVRYYLAVLHKDLGTVINKLDIYMAEGQRSHNYNGHPDSKSKKAAHLSGQRISAAAYFTG